MLVLKAGAIWLTMVIFAIANGIVREKILVPITGGAMALPLSGITLSIVVFLIAYISLPFLGRPSANIYLMIGLQWVLMTVLFEIVFGHYVAGKPWQELLHLVNIMQGNLFILVLAVTLLSPFLAAKLHGYL